MSSTPVPFVVAGAALVVYLLLGQNAMHGFDAYYYLRWVHDGHLHNSLNVLYLPAAWTWSQALGACGVPLYEALRALSAVGAACGVLCCHAAATALGLGRERAAMVASGCAATPAVVHAASVVEIDALLFACAALAWLPFARLLRSEHWRWAVLTGLCTAFAAGFHAAGHLLAVALCGLNLAWGFRRRPLRTTLPRSLAAAAVHSLATLLLGCLAGAAGQATMAENMFELDLQLDFAPHVLWHEWLLPYAPFCVLVVAALRPRDLRGAAVGFGLCLLLYLLVTTRILGPLRDTGPFLPQGDMTERGSFLLALTVPAVTLSAMALPARAGWAAVTAAAFTGIAAVRSHDWPADPAGYAAGFAAIAAREPVYLLAADAQEWAWIARRLPGAPCSTIAQMELTELREHATKGFMARAEHYALWFELQLERQEALGRSLLVTPRALARMRDSADPHLAQAAREMLPAAFTFTPVAAQGFAALRVHKQEK